MSSLESILGDAPFDLAAKLTKVPLLRSVALPQGTRELRIADWYQMVAGSPIPYLTLVEDGQEIAGALAVLEGCGVDREPKGVKWCARVVTSAHGLDWNAVARTLDSLGVWNLRDPCETDGLQRTDSGALMLQRLEGSAFSTYTCNTPSLRSGPVGERSRAIYAFFHELIRRHAKRPA
jgi:hypothetical protein